MPRSIAAISSGTSLVLKVQFANLTLGENEAANAVLGGLKTLKGSVLRLGFVFLMSAAVELCIPRCIDEIAIRVHGCACSSFTFGNVSIRVFVGHVSMRVFGFGRCKRCAGNGDNRRQCTQIESETRSFASGTKQSRLSAKPSAAPNLSRWNTERSRWCPTKSVCLRPTPSWATATTLANIPCRR
jgi:hypothetical protein